MRFATALLVGFALTKVWEITQVAHYEAFIFIGNFFIFFWLAAIHKGLLTQYKSQKKEVQATYLFNIFLLTLGLSIFFAGGLFLFKDIIFLPFPDFKNLPYIELISWYMLFNTPSLLIEYIYLLKNKPQKIVLYGIIVFSLQLALIVVPALSGFGVKIVFQALIFLAILKCCWLFVVLHKYSKFQLKLSYIRAFSLFIFPLMLHQLLGGGMEYIDGFIVTHFFETEQFAIFRYGTKELPLVTLMAGALVAALIPEAVVDMNNCLQKIKQKTLGLYHWLYPITFVLLLIAPLAFPIFYNESYKASARIFNVYLLIISSRLLLPQVIIYGKKHNSILVFSAFIEIIINISLSLCLLQKYGLVGIAIATVIAYLLNKIILIAYNYYKFAIAPIQYINLKWYLFYNSLLLVFFAISYLY